ncbi:hypothetical protein [Sphingobacterium hungaricum]|uniref:Uncharacterized protein n=1 Tax=Sphingobacterium hungaricum TaxID=2082723 RepID=A0A928UYC4_9SPHI|nr:hypothetical protein [Sphingobacterium hungaricum]MBE8713676.1 hypothetical protein [Sphingobacterium hungaricum]
MFKGKTILFGAPSSFGFSAVIKEELLNLGFNIVDFSMIHHEFKYKNIFDRAYNCYRKVVHNDYQYKHHLKAEARHEHLMNYLKQIGQAEYALFIRPDYFPKDFIKAVSKKANSLIAYQWDGLNRFPNVKEYIQYFDSFFVFDAEDLVHENVKPITNFYFENMQNGESNKGAYFLGSYEPERLKQIISLKDCLEDMEYENDFFIQSNSQSAIKKIKKHGLHHIDSDVNYEENIKNTLNSSLLIDIHNPVHHGLSFRIFESIGYNKKIITTNKEVTKYDFYQENNIFVLEEENYGDIKNFIETPYQPIAPSIKQKYCFTNWIKYVLNTEGHVPLNLPSVN